MLEWKWYCDATLERERVQYGLPAIVRGSSTGYQLGPTFIPGDKDSLSVLSVSVSGVASEGSVTAVNDRPYLL